MFSPEVERLAHLVQGTMSLEGQEFNEEATTQVKLAIQLRIEPVGCAGLDTSSGDVRRSVVGVLNYNGIICD